jgi:hypothetical protein
MGVCVDSSAWVLLIAACTSVRVASKPHVLTANAYAGFAILLPGGTGFRAVGRFVSFALIGVVLLRQAAMRLQHVQGSAMKGKGREWLQMHHVT